MCEIRCFNSEAWDLYHDLRVLTELVSDRVPPQETLAIGQGKEPLVRPSLDTAWAGRLLYDLNAVCNILDPSDSNTWVGARRKLAELLAIRNGGVCHELSAIGHAHIDCAWLWPLAESYRKTVRTFSSAVRNMDDYPNSISPVRKLTNTNASNRRILTCFSEFEKRSIRGNGCQLAERLLNPIAICPRGNHFADNSFLVSDTSKVDLVSDVQNFGIRMYLVTLISCHR